jgi:exosome complex component RRP45
MSRRDHRPETFQKTRSRSNWRRNHHSKWNAPRNFPANSGVFQHPPSERAPVPLAIHHTPFCFTFAFFPDITTPPLLDPSHLEQRLSAGLLSVALNAQKEMCVFQKLGGVPLAPSDILKIINVAVLKAQEVHAYTENRLREDWANRTVEFR